MSRNAVEPENRLYGFTAFSFPIFRRSGIADRRCGRARDTRPRSPGAARLANQGKHC